MNSMPIIKLTVEGMKSAIFMALSEQQVLFDQAARAAIDDFCRPESINAIVAEHVTQAINSAVSDEVRRYFNHSSAGRAAIREAVRERLDLLYPVRDDEGSDS